MYNCGSNNLGMYGTGYYQPQPNYPAFQAQQQQQNYAAYQTVAAAAPVYSQTNAAYGGGGGLASYGGSFSSNDVFQQAQPNNATVSNATNAFDLNDPLLLQQVEQIVQSLNETKRPILRRQVITVPSNCPGRVTFITRRLPTPPPDIIERITVVKPARDVVNLCIEKPTQPPPFYQQKEVVGKPKKPLIQPRVISVAPRANPQPVIQQPLPQQPPACAPAPPVCPQPVYAPQPQPQPCYQPQQSSSYNALNSYAQPNLVNSTNAMGFYGYAC